MAPGRPSKDNNLYPDTFGALDGTPNFDLGVQNSRAKAKRPARKPNLGPRISGTDFGSSDRDELDDYSPIQGAVLPSSGNFGLPTPLQINSSQRPSRPTKRVGSRPPIHGANGLQTGHTSIDRNGQTSTEPPSRPVVQCSDARSGSSTRREGARFARWLLEQSEHYPNHDSRDRELFIAACQYWYGLEEDDINYVPAREASVDDLKVILEGDAANTSKNPDNTWTPVAIGQRNPGKLILWERRAKNSQLVKAIDYLVSKTVSEQPNFFRDYVIEARLVRRLNFVGCGNVPKVYDWSTIGGGQTRIIYEYCRHGELSRLINFYQANRLFIPEAFIWHVFYSLVKVLCYCENGSLDPDRKEGWDSIVHLNMNIRNVLLADPNASDNGFYPSIKFRDFEGAYTIPNEPLQREGVQRYQSDSFWPGISPYAPREQLAPLLQRTGDTHPENANHSDIRSLGKTMEDLFLASLACYDKHTRSIFLAAYSKGDRQVWNQYNYRYTDQLTTLIRSCIQVHGNSRFTIQDLLRATGRRNEEFKIKVSEEPRDDDGVYDGMVLYSRELQEYYKERKSVAEALHSYFRYPPIKKYGKRSGNAVRGTVQQSPTYFSGPPQSPESSPEEFPMRGIPEKVLSSLPTVEPSEEDSLTRDVSQKTRPPPPISQASADDVSEREWRERAPSPSQSPISLESYTSSQSPGSPIAPYAGGLLSATGIKTFQSPQQSSARLPPEPISPKSWRKRPSTSDSIQKSPKQQPRRPSRKSDNSNSGKPSSRALAQPNTSTLQRQNRGGITKPPRPSTERLRPRPSQRSEPSLSTSPRRLRSREDRQTPPPSYDATPGGRDSPSAEQFASVAHQGPTSHQPSHQQQPQLELEQQQLDQLQQQNQQPTPAPPKYLVSKFKEELSPTTPTAPPPPPQSTHHHHHQPPPPYQNSAQRYNLRSRTLTASSAFDRLGGSVSGRLRRGGRGRRRDTDPERE
ncbi:MAG: hypothetical protein M1835_000068, partial [Candelina submexicana]